MRVVVVLMRVVVILMRVVVIVTSRLGPNRSLWYVASGVVTSQWGPHRSLWYGRVRVGYYAGLPRRSEVVDC
jgi:hypothetical protein